MVLLSDEKLSLEISYTLGFGEGLESALKIITLVCENVANHLD